MNSMNGVIKLPETVQKGDQLHLSASNHWFSGASLFLMRVSTVRSFQNGKICFKKLGSIAEVPLKEKTSSLYFHSVSGEF